MGGGSSDGWDWDEHGSWRSVPKAPVCDAFNPYVSNPLLCHCNRPIQEHPTAMAKVQKKQEEERLRRAVIIDGVMEVLGIDLIPDPGDEIIEIVPGYKMKRRDFEALRDIIRKEEATKETHDPPAKTCTHKNPDGSWAIDGGMFCNSCRLCGWSDL